ncbi:MAG: lamin tail domain-containing protein [Clostridia bacterium]|nr:lamin tail domain-containing protein [Clostridia bacterium]
MKKFLSILLLTCLLAAVIPAQAATTNLAAIRINEFMASNGDTIEDKNGEDSDWIELYNTSDDDVNLKGLCLSDGKKNLEKFVFPEYILPAHGYLIIFASGTEDVDENEIHVAFKLSASGEKVVLSYQGVLLDSISFDQQEKDVSMARVDERNWKYTSLPTPGAENAFDD